MEVHHHPDVHHKPKKWKEYFLEFIMIFLAVTLGFIAENIREHITEKAKERKYIEGFIRNLKDDTATLNHVIRFDARLINGIDSMLRLSHANMIIDSNRKAFYYYATRYCYSSSAFKSNDITLQQLKSTGDYKLIERDHVADSLIKYGNDVQNIYNQGEYYLVYFKDILSRLDELTDRTVLNDSSYLISGNLPNKPLPLLRDKDGQLATLFNKLFDFKLITQSYSENNLKPQLKNAKRLILFLQSTYDIGNE